MDARCTTQVASEYLWVNPTVPLGDPLFVEHPAGPRTDGETRPKWLGTPSKGPPGGALPALEGVPKSLIPTGGYHLRGSKMADSDVIGPTVGDWSDEEMDEDEGVVFYPSELENGHREAGVTALRPPPLPYQQKRYLENKPIVRHDERFVKKITNVPAAVQSVLARAAGPQFGFADPLKVAAVQEIQEEDELEGLDSVLDRSFFWFSEDGTTRKVCTILSDSAYFDHFVIVLIGINSACLAMYDPINKESAANATLDMVGKILTLLFLVEMLIKMIAKGVIFGQSAYLTESGWNWVDFVVVVSGMTDFIPNYDNKLGVFRTIRLLRPLRTITSIRGMRVLVGTLLQPDTLSGIGNVCLLCCFIFVIFGIIGVNLFAGTLQRRCYSDTDLLLVSEDQMCGASGHQCELSQQ